MTPEDYEKWIAKVENGFFPTLEQLQENVLKAAERHKQWLNDSLAPREITSRNGVTQPQSHSRKETTLEVYLRCKEELRKAVYNLNK